MRNWYTKKFMTGEIADHVFQRWTGDMSLKRLAKLCKELDAIEDESTEIDISQIDNVSESPRKAMTDQLRKCLTIDRERVAESLTMGELKSYHDKSGIEYFVGLK